MKSHVVINDCVGGSPGAIDVRWRTTHSGNKGNWTFDYIKFAKHLPAQLTSVGLDWLEVFGALYAVDRVCRRPTQTWVRDIEVDIPVRDPDVWNSVTPAVRDVWNQLTGDRLAARFHRESDPAEPPRTDLQSPRGVTEVALFSGGIDSFGAVARLVAGGAKPALVSHLANPTVEKAIATLLARLPDVPRPAPLPIVARNGSRSGLDTEESQRARTLLYIASAIIAARAFKTGNVCVGENGILSVHEPETEARVPSLSTRTAHPQVLRAVQTLAESVFGTRVTVGNPLEGLTKSGVVALCQSLGHGDAIPSSVSCWKISRKPIHCGTCIPCLQRFVATDYMRNPDTTYQANPWDAPGSEAGAADEIDNLVHLLQLAQSIDRSSDHEIELDHPGLIGVGGALSDRQRIDLHRQWATEVLTVADKHPRSREIL